MKTSVFLDIFRRYHNIGKVALDETVDFKHNTSSLRVEVESTPATVSWEFPEPAFQFLMGSEYRACSSPF